jgi:hypothetical protein
VRVLNEVCLNQVALTFERDLTDAVIAEIDLARCIIRAWRRLSTQSARAA